METCIPLFRRRGWLWSQPRQAARLDSALETNWSGGWSRAEEMGREHGDLRLHEAGQPRGGDGPGQEQGQGPGRRKYCQRIEEVEESKIAAEDRIVKQEGILEEKGE